MHINAFLGKAINKVITRPNQAHMYSDKTKNFSVCNLNETGMSSNDT